MKKYIPKVGDSVRLLISDSNMNEEMKEIVKNNPIVTVTAIEEITYGDNPKIRIRFDGDKRWDWTLYDNHFEYVNNSNKSHNKALIKLIKYATK